MKFRLNVLPNDYGKAYGILGDGILKGCLGKDCPNSCCGKKEMIDDNGNKHQYRTTFFDEAEARYQSQLERQDPKLVEMGVMVTRIQVEGVTCDLVSGCLDEGNGCKLELVGRKPITCRTFPIGVPFGDTGEGESACPVRGDILARNDNLREKIQKVDRTLKISQIRADTQRRLARKKER